VIEHGKYQGNSETNEKYSGYDEDHECHVYDFFIQDAEGQKNPV